MSEVTERLYKTEDGRVVVEGHPDARWLYATPGDVMPEPEPTEAEPEPVKEAEPDGDKQVVAVEDKASGLTITRSTSRRKKAD